MECDCVTIVLGVVRSFLLLFPPFQVLMDVMIWDSGSSMRVEVKDDQKGSRAEPNTSFGSSFVNYFVNVSLRKAP